MSLKFSFSIKQFVQCVIAPDVHQFPDFVKQTLPPVLQRLTADITSREETQMPTRRSKTKFALIASISSRLHISFTVSYGFCFEQTYIATFDMIQIMYRARLLDMAMYAMRH